MLLFSQLSQALSTAYVVSAYCNKFLSMLSYLEACINFSFLRSPKMTFSFKDIEHSKSVVKETSLYTHYHNETAPFMYFENYVIFHRVPTFG